MTQLFAQRLRWCLVVLTASAASGACSQTPIVRQGPSQQRVVARTWKEPVAVVRVDVLTVFGDEHSMLPVPFNRMTASELLPPRFSPDWLDTFVDPGGFVKDYRALDPSARNLDLLIDEPTGAQYWTSEYLTPSGAAQFRCGFILHFADSPDGTTVEVYEHVPTVWAGEHWAWAMHGIGFGRYHDIRFVEPTVQDRIRVLDLVNEIVTSRG